MRYFYDRFFCSVVFFCFLAGIGESLSQNIYTLAGYTPNTSLNSGNEMGGGQATDIGVASPSGITVDASGNMFVLEGTGIYNRVRKIYTTGAIQTVVGYYGSGCCSSTGDGGLATAATINLNNTNVSVGICFDASGNYYIADQGGHKIRKVDISTGIISIVAGNGTSGSAGDGGAATSANLSRPTGVALDASGNIYIADRGNHKIRKVTISTGIITTIAGTGAAGSTGDGGAATAATLNRPTGVAVDASGNVYFVDYTNNKIRKITSGGVISTVAGTGASGYTGDGAAATAATTNITAGSANGSSSLAVDASGDFYFADGGNHVVRKVTVSTGVITTVAGTGVSGFSGDGAAATAAQLNTPRAVFVDGSGNIYIADRGNHRVRKVSISTGFISTVAGNGTTSAFTSSACSRLAMLWFIKDVAVDNAGNAYVCTNAGLTAIWKITPGGVITAAASGVSASGVTVDASNNDVYFVNDNEYISKIDASTGVVTHVAGTGVTGYTGDGGLATAATLNTNGSGVVTGIALDAAGNIYFSDNGNQVIRKITVSTGIITTVAGNGTSGFSGDGGAATSARLFDPQGIDIDGSGNIYIADAANYRIRKVTVATGNISTIMGTGASGDPADGATALGSAIGYVHDVCLNRTNGDFYISYGSKVRKITAATGLVSTVAGTGVAGFSGDGGAATAAQLNGPTGITRDASTGCIFIADWSNSKLRVVDVSGTCYATAGNCTGLAFLPVELLSFTANCVKSSAFIRWSTASEINNDYFSIERSSDGKTWTEVGTVNGAENSSTIRNYEFIDETPLSQYNGEDGRAFYRLRQIDFDGKFEYFGPVSVSCLEDDDWNMVIRSIMSDKTVSGTFIAAEDAELSLRVIDAQGKPIKSQSIDVKQGSNYLSVELDHIVPGMYFISLQNAKVNLVRKFIKN